MSMFKYTLYIILLRVRLETSAFKGIFGIHYESVHDLAPPTKTTGEQARPQHQGIPGENL